ncbi:hypothetical protein D3C81_1088170 [compost metagenome]
MAHGRQEARLGQVRRFGIILGAHQAGSAPLDHLLQLVALVLQGQAVDFTAVDITENGPAHVVQGVGHGVDFVCAGRAAFVQAQRLLPVARADAPGKLGHHLQMASDQAVKQARQRHRQAAEEHAHPQQAGQPGGEQAPVHRTQVDADLQLAKVAQRPGRRLIVQGETLDAQRPLWRRFALQQVEVGTAQAYPRHI